jgi:hypothetical protein
MIILNDPEYLKQSFLNMVNEVLELPYDEPTITRSTITTKAVSNSKYYDSFSIAWELDILKGEFTFCMRRDGEVFIGKGNTILEAFENKEQI